MDGATIATLICGSIIIGGAIGGGFWKLGRAIGTLEGKMDSVETQVSETNNKIDGYGETIGHLRGTIDGVDVRVHSYEKQMDGIDKRVSRLDRRINGWLDSHKTEPK